jgi:DNA repair exonuclease SbcCD ATPase subunit
MSDKIINELTERIQRLKDGYEGCCTACEPVGEMNQKLRQEVEQLRREYEEARHLCCVMSINPASAFRLEFEQKIEQLRRERDEARRLCCKMLASAPDPLYTTMTAQDYAAENGWDCFKDNANDE